MPKGKRAEDGWIDETGIYKTIPRIKQRQLSLASSITVLFLNELREL